MRSWLGQRAYFAVFAAIFVAQPSMAHDCESDLVSIVRTPQPLYALELERAGTVLRPGEQVGSLPQGPYVFLLARDGRLAYAPKYNAQAFTASNTGLATHKNLIDLLGEGADIVASGEWRVAFGMVVSIGNRSGNFRGGVENFAYAQSRLPEFGLPFAPDIKALTHKPHSFATGHAPSDREADQYYLEVLARIESDSRAQRLKKIYEDLIQLLLPYARVKSPLGVSGLIVDATLELKQNFGTEYFIFPIESACSADGIEFALERMLEPDRALGYLRSAPDVIGVVGRYLGRKLSARDRAELNKMKLRFKELRSRS